LGGHQIYLVCPTCFTPRGALFFHQDCFSCRVCHRLCYSSQRQRLPDRLRGKLEKLAKQLGSCYEWGNVSIPARPKGMRHATYEALASQYRRLKAQYHAETTRKIAHALS
jgi:hypothetical protein